MEFDFFEHKGILHFFSMSYALGQDFFSDFFFHFAKVSFKKGLKKIMMHLKVNSLFRKFSIFSMSRIVVCVSMVEILSGEV